jgi:eukaryotic-like serine/threonine-protein kinase
LTKEDEELLTKALGFYEDFAERNRDDSNVRREVANAYHRAGVIHTSVGHFDQAKVALDRATVICARLVEDFPTDKEPKNLLAQVHLQKGVAAQHQGDFAATQDLQKGIDLLEPLLTTADLQPECLETLSRLHGYIGFSLVMTGDLQQGELHDREAIKLQAKVVEKTDDLPRKLLAIMALANGHSNLGMLLHHGERLDEAAGEHRQAIDLLTQVDAQASTLPGYQNGRVRGFPNRTSVHDQLALAYLKWSRELRDIGQSKAAENNLKQALELWTQHLQDRPGELSIHFCLAMVETDLGQLVFEGGRRPEAHDHYNRSIEHLRKLDSASPGKLLWGIFLANSRKSLGDLMLAEAQPEKAAEQYRQALVIYQGLADRYPDNVEVANDLAWFLALCADPRFRDPARAVSLAQKTVHQVPQSGSYWNTLGLVRYRAGQWRESVTALEKAMALRKGGNSSDWIFLAMAHWQLGEKEEARNWYEKAVTELKKFEYPLEEEGRWLAEATALLKTKADGP